MKKVIQTKLHKPKDGTRGNCMAACFSCITEIPIKDIPAFEDIEGDVYRQRRRGGSFAVMREHV